MRVVLTHLSHDRTPSEFASQVAARHDLAAT